MSSACAASGCTASKIKMKNDERREKVMAHLFVAAAPRVRIVVVGRGGEGAHACGAERVEVAHALCAV